jgi:hypothetical protein
VASSTWARFPAAPRGQALGVNERGQVVGLSRVGGLTATLRDDGRVWNLNDLAVGHDGHLFHANDVNAAADHWRGDQRRGRGRGSRCDAPP